MVVCFENGQIQPQRRVEKPKIIEETNKWDSFDSE